MTTPANSTTRLRESKRPKPKPRTNNKKAKKKFLTHTTLSQPVHIKRHVKETKTYDLTLYSENQEFKLGLPCVWHIEGYKSEFGIVSKIDTVRIGRRSYSIVSSYPPHSIIINGKPRPTLALLGVEHRDAIGLITQAYARAKSLRQLPPGSNYELSVSGFNEQLRCNMYKERIPNSTRNYRGTLRHCTDNENRIYTVYFEDGMTKPIVTPGMINYLQLTCDVCGRYAPRICSMSEPGGMMEDSISKGFCTFRYCSIPCSEMNPHFHSKLCGHHRVVNFPEASSLPTIHESARPTEIVKETKDAPKMTPVEETSDEKIKGLNQQLKKLELEKKKQKNQLPRLVVPPPPPLPITSVTPRQVLKRPPPPPPAPSTPLAANRLTSPPFPPPPHTPHLPLSYP